MATLNPKFIVLLESQHEIPEFLHEKTDPCSRRRQTPYGGWSRVLTCPLLERWCYINYFFTALDAAMIFINHILVVIDFVLLGLSLSLSFTRCPQLRYIGKRAHWRWLIKDFLCQRSWNKRANGCRNKKIWGLTLKRKNFLWDKNELAFLKVSSFFRWGTRFA
jgi:hypothetical protein